MGSSPGSQARLREPGGVLLTRLGCQCDSSHFDSSVFNTGLSTTDYSIVSPNLREHEVSLLAEAPIHKGTESRNGVNVCEVDIQLDLQRMVRCCDDTTSPERLSCG